MSDLEVAVLDEAGVIIAVIAVSPDDYKSDPVARTVALPANHDMRGNLHCYKYDFVRGRFEPIVLMGRATREGVEFADAVVATLHLLAAKMGMQIPDKLKQAMNVRGDR